MDFTAFRLIYFFVEINFIGRRKFINYGLLCSDLIIISSIKDANPLLRARIGITRAHQHISLGPPPSLGLLPYGENNFFLLLIKNTCKIFRPSLAARLEKEGSLVQGEEHEEGEWGGNSNNLCAYRPLNRAILEMCAEISIFITFCWSRSKFVQFWFRSAAVEGVKVEIQCNPKDGEYYPTEPTVRIPKVIIIYCRELKFCLRYCPVGNSSKSIDINIVGVVLIFRNQFKSIHLCLSWWMNIVPSSVYFFREKKRNKNLFGSWNFEKVLNQQKIGKSMKSL